MATVICYKTIEPTIYNKGTKHETSRDTFLAYYTYKTTEQAQKECDELNTVKPEKHPMTKEKLNWNKIKYFFVDEQEEMY